MTKIIFGTFTIVVRYLAVLCKRFYIPATILFNNVDKNVNSMEPNYLSLDINEVLQCEYEGITYYEEWKPIKDYEGLYEISSFGRVKSLERWVKHWRGAYKLNKEKILAQSLIGLINRDYFRVTLYREGKAKTCKIHQLVAIVFRNHTPNGLSIVVDHVNNNRFDNFYLNLQLITSRENSSKDKIGNSKYTGVHWYKPYGIWVARIRIGNKNKYLGYFKCELRAAFTYNIALKSLQNA